MSALEKIAKDKKELLEFIEQSKAALNRAAGALEALSRVEQYLKEQECNISSAPQKAEE